MLATSALQMFLWFFWVPVSCWDLPSVSASGRHPETIWRTLLREAEASPRSRPPSPPLLDQQEDEKVLRSWDLEWLEFQQLPKQEQEETPVSCPGSDRKQLTFWRLAGCRGDAC